MNLGDKVVIEPFDLAELQDLVARSEFANEPAAVTSFMYQLKASSEVWVGRYDGKAAIVWGLIPPSLLSNQVYLWLATTEVVVEHKFLLARYSRLFMDELLTRYDTVIGCCKITHQRSIRWLKWLGAEFNQPMKDNLPFVIRRK